MKKREDRLKPAEKKSAVEGTWVPGEGVGKCPTEQTTLKKELSLNGPEITGHVAGRLRKGEHY